MLRLERHTMKELSGTLSQTEKPILMEASATCTAATKTADPAVLSAAHLALAA